MIIRPIRRGDYEALYGESPRHSIRGLTAEKDGRPVGLAAIVYIENQVIAVSRFTDMTKREVARGALSIARLMRELNCPVLALAEPGMESAPKLLGKLGFEHVASNSQGEVFRWRQRQQ